MSGGYKAFDVFGLGKNYESELGSKIKQRYDVEFDGFLFLGYEKDEKGDDIAVLVGLYNDKSRGNVIFERPIALPANALEAYTNKELDVLTDKGKNVEELKKNYETAIEAFKARIEQAAQQQAQAAGN
ncbi:MAG: hypothetical protein GXO64_03535 [Candidatus Micrarchaeota archaeon]|nr:hypothetical protein [Candidatus Micrarchaeota archaeon]